MASIARIAVRAVESHCSHSPGRSDNILSSNMRLFFTFARLASLFSDNAVPLSLCFEGRCLEELDDMLQEDSSRNIETRFDNIYYSQIKVTITAIDLSRGSFTERKHLALYNKSQTPPWPACVLGRHVFSHYSSTTLLRRTRT